jgi:hypothetical protein
MVDSMKFHGGLFYKFDKTRIFYVILHFGMERVIENY